MQWPFCPHATRVLALKSLLSLVIHWSGVATTTFPSCRNMVKNTFCVNHQSSGYITGAHGLCSLNQTIHIRIIQWISPINTWPVSILLSLAQGTRANQVPSVWAADLPLCTRRQAIPGWVDPPTGLLPRWICSMGPSLQLSQVCFIHICVPDNKLIPSILKINTWLIITIIRHNNNQEHKEPEQPSTKTTNNYVHTEANEIKAHESTL